MGDESVSGVGRRISIIRGPSAMTLIVWANRIRWFVMTPCLPILLLVLALSQTGWPKFQPLFVALLVVFLISVLVAELLYSVLSRIRESQEVRLGYTSFGNYYFELPQVAPDTGIVIREPGQPRLERDESRLAVAAAKEKWMLVLAELGQSKV
jgi:hypothetical protein